MAEIYKNEDYVLDSVKSKKLTGSTAIGLDQNIIFTTKPSGKNFVIEFNDIDEFHTKILSTQIS